MPEEFKRTKYRRSAWKGTCEGCGKGFGEGDEKYANLWDFPKKEFCKKCFWDNKNAPQTVGKRFEKVEHKSYMTGGSSQRFDDDDPVDGKFEGTAHDR